MANCWERGVPLPFHLCCFNFRVGLVVCVPFPFGVWDRMWNSIGSVPEHCLLICYSLMNQVLYSIFVLTG